MTTRGRRRFLAGMFAGALACAGCDLQTLAYFLSPEYKEPPELGAILNKDKKKTNRVAILTYFNLLETRSEVLQIDRELAGVLARQIKEQCEADEEKIDLVSPRKVEEYKNTHTNWKQTDLPEIGRALKADYLIYIEINSVKLYDTGSLMFRGRADLVVTLVDVNKPDDDPRTKDRIHYVYPTDAHGGIPIDMDTNVGQFREKFVTFMAERLSWFFLPHRKRDGAYVGAGSPFGG